MPATLTQSELDTLHASVLASNHEEQFLRKFQGTGDPTHQRREQYLADRGWKFLGAALNPPNKHGYYGIAYYRYDAKKREVEILFAHRGTCFNKPGNLQADVDILEGHMNPPILTEAADPFVNHALENALKRSPTKSVIKKITHTGFSLGGFIAGAIAARSATNNVYAITFDAPGCAYLLSETQRAQKAAQVTNFVTAPNGVNTCNEHLGTVHQFTHFFNPAIPDEEPHNIALFFGIEVTKQKLLSFAELMQTAKTHSLELLLTQLETQGHLQKIKTYKWPTAQISLTYGPDREIAYRDKFINKASMESFLDTAWPMALWVLTCGRSGRPDHGVTSLFYRRDNKVCYTEQEYNNRLLYTIALYCTVLAIGLAQAITQQRKVAERGDTARPRPGISLHS